MEVITCTVRLCERKGEREGAVEWARVIFRGTSLIRNAYPPRRTIGL